MVVFITGSPFIDGAERALLNPDNQLLDRLYAVLPRNPRVLFVASNPDDHAGTCRFGADVFCAFAEADIPFSKYTVLDATNAQSAKKLVHSSDFIIFAGGHVPTQNAFLNAIRMRQLLSDYDGVVMGISAGSMNLADTVYVQPEEPGESSPDFVRFAPGLGLTPVNILPHYQKVKDNYLDGKRLYEDITFADSVGHEFFVLPDNSYFYQDEDGLLLCGKGYRLRNGIMEQLTDDEDVLDTVLLD